MRILVTNASPSSSLVEAAAGVASLQGEEDEDNESHDIVLKHDDQVLMIEDVVVKDSAMIGSEEKNENENEISIEDNTISQSETVINITTETEGMESTKSYSQVDLEAPSLRLSLIEDNNANEGDDDFKQGHPLHPEDALKGDGDVKDLVTAGINQVSEATSTTEEEKPMGQGDDVVSADAINEAGDDGYRLEDLNTEGDVTEVIIADREAYTHAGYIMEDANEDDFLKNHDLEEMVETKDKNVDDIFVRIDVKDKEDLGISDCRSGEQQQADSIPALTSENVGDDMVATTSVNPTLLNSTSTSTIAHILHQEATQQQLRGDNTVDSGLAHGRVVAIEEKDYVSILIVPNNGSDTTGDGANNNRDPSLADEHVETLQEMLLLAQQELSRRLEDRSSIEKAYETSLKRAGIERKRLRRVETALRELPGAHRRRQKDMTALIKTLSSEVAALDNQVRIAKQKLEELEKTHQTSREDVRSQVESADERLATLNANRKKATTICEEIRQNISDGKIKDLQAQIHEVRRRMETIVAPVSVELLSELDLGSNSHEFLFSVAQKRAGLSTEAGNNKGGGATLSSTSSSSSSSSVT